jgi:hypothetical protein
MPTMMMMKRGADGSSPANPIAITPADSARLAVLSLWHTQFSLAGGGVPFLKLSNSERLIRCFLPGNHVSYFSSIYYLSTTLPPSSTHLPFSSPHQSHIHTHNVRQRLPYQARQRRRWWYPQPRLVSSEHCLIKRQWHKLTVFLQVASRAQRQNSPTAHRRHRPIRQGV